MLFAQKKKNLIWIFYKYRMGTRALTEYTWKFLSVHLLRVTNIKNFFAFESIGVLNFCYAISVSYDRFGLFLNPPNPSRAFPKWEALLFFRPGERLPPRKDKPGFIHNLIQLDIVVSIKFVKLLHQTGHATSSSCCPENLRAAKQIDLNTYFS